MSKTLTILFIALCGIAVAVPVRSMMTARQSIISASPSLPPLPDGVVAVEYLESDGASYILTGIKNPNAGAIAYDVTFSYTNRTASETAVVFRIRNSSSYSNSGIDMRSGSRNWITIRSGGGNFGSGYVNQFNRKIRVYCDASGNYNIDDGAFVGVITPQGIFSYQSPVGLFGDFFNTNTPSIAGVRIYEGKLVKEGLCDFHFIPVRVGNVGYMYDLNNPKGGPNENGLYGNSGTGSFIIGPDL